MAADEKYPVLNRDNLTIPIETQLYEKQKNFFELAAAFLRSRLNFKCFKKKIFWSYILYFQSYGLRKRSEINV